MSQIGIERGTYSAVKVDKRSLQCIKSLQERFISKPSNLKDIHCTVIYSRYEEIIDYPVINHMDITANVTGFEVWEMESGKYCLVALLESEFLSNRHLDLCERFNITPDYAIYKPHITLSYDVSRNFNTNNLKPWLSQVRFISEYTKPVKY